MEHQRAVSMVWTGQERSKSKEKRGKQDTGSQTSPGETVNEDRSPSKALGPEKKVKRGAG